MFYKHAAGAAKTAALVFNFISHCPRCHPSDGSSSLHSCYPTLSSSSGSSVGFQTSLYHRSLPLLAIWLQLVWPSYSRFDSRFGRIEAFTLPKIRKPLLSFSANYSNLGRLTTTPPIVSEEKSSAWRIRGLTRHGLVPVPGTV